MKLKTGIVSPLRTFALVLILVGLFGTLARSANLDVIGVTLLRTVTTNLDGSGVRVAQPEAGAPFWQVNPTNVLVQQSPAIFTFTADGGSTNGFPNSLGVESAHADDVASNFYGLFGGIVTNVAHVDNFEANFFYTNYVASPAEPDTQDPVVNQSFIFSGVTTAEQQELDSQFDDYAVKNHALFVSGIGNGGAVNPPATCYNGIGVGAYGGSSSVGPTPDNGRAQPDLVAPADLTSFSTPQVSGAAAILMQAGLRGDGGGDTNSAADLRTIKSLLLNGAVKPSDWTNIFPSPLDARYGAGVLNVFNSYEQLAGGKNNFIVSTSIATNSPHPPTGDLGTIAVLSGWDFNTNTSSAHFNGVNHYYFDVTNFSGAPFTATATLVWNRHQNKTNINNLDLFLYDALSSNLVACSTSLVDNVEHIFLPRFAPGRYDLQVLKRGGSVVSTNETYALAWAFFSETLNAKKAGTNVVLTFPIYPAGFLAETTTNLSPPVIWGTNDLPSPLITNGQNLILINPTNPAQFFQLRAPDF